MESAKKTLRAIFDQAAVGIAQISLDGAWLRVTTAIVRCSATPKLNCAQRRFAISRTQTTTMRFIFGAG
jgi:hypothetical protein